MQTGLGITCAYEGFCHCVGTLRHQCGLWLLIRLATVPPSASDEALSLAEGQCKTDLVATATVGYTCDKGAAFIKL